MIGLTRRRMAGGALTVASAIGSGAVSLAEPVAGTRSADAVEEASYVQIGGIQQWLQLRGASRRNPVILVIHGGPGSTWDPLIGLFPEWEQRFTMAYWDQRGAGKTYHLTGPDIGPTMTIDRMVQDTIEVAEYLRLRTGHRKIIALAHSWGTVLGVMAVQKRPDLFSAYVGTGQLVNVLESEREGRLETLRRARAAGRADAVVELDALGSPPYDDINKMVVERKWADAFDTPSDAAFNKAWRNPPDFTPEQSAERRRAWLFSTLIMFGQKQQDGPVMKVNFFASARKFRIPMIFIQGSDDHITPTSLVVRYEREIVAPKKVLSVLRGGGHDAITTMPDKFLATMRQALGPLGAAQD